VSASFALTNRPPSIRAGGSAAGAGASPTGGAAAAAAGLGLYLRWRVAPMVDASRNDRAFGLALRATW